MRHPSLPCSLSPDAQGCAPPGLRPKYVFRIDLM
eukprot:SAG31_NODE_1787_length_7268_cov_6.628679_5_plen_33_part_01